ncbi:Succinate--CoA ligase subunit beta [Penicillium canariense]|uniref:Succinate--CoA ligase subunit beta n=1 Tax=Penicillium canariense TaxID=189055 RepID=A0A9W9I1Y2_9EURO|nr:Succinate--CoA ligase subunit beta [Penicillium canariense]KAJ5166356.1 Succinate--CoA ligase subunit beta [Penicillium canariense]
MFFWAYFCQFDIPVPDGFVVGSPEEAREVVSKISALPVGIGDDSLHRESLAQILAGGRGKGKYESDGKGGVRIMNSPIEAFENASRMIGYYLTTNQTPPNGLLVKKLYIYKAVDVAQEFYVALTFDRARYMPVLLISDVGGVDIESNADKLQQYWFDMTHGITREIISYIQAQLGFADPEIAVISHILHQMVKLFREKDATLLELNPLVRTPEGNFVCLDAKFTFDNSARFRQPEIFSLEERLPEEEDQYEASQLGLSYVRLDGDIGNIVNGAGLAMATNDLVGLHGGKCANFLDVGGGATEQTLSKAFEILNRDSRIKGILINIYGGIVRCDMIAESIVAAAASTGGFRVPVVVRLQGTNCEKGLKLIESSGLGNVTVEPDFELAAEKIVELVELAGKPT